MLPTPRKHATRVRPDRLMRALGRIEVDLQQWIRSSAENARMFRQDPIAAMRAAGLDMEDELICELEQITQGIARKLK